jgi:hypothetical protein
MANEERRELIIEAIASTEAQLRKLQEELSAMGMRERLPNRRGSTLLDFEHAGLHYTCTYSCYGDGRLAEAFLNQHKTDSAADAFARDGAIFISIALQFGAALATLQRAAQRNPDGTASSALGHALDLIARDIAADAQSIAAAEAVKRDDGLKAVIKAAGGIESLARALGVNPSAVAQWTRAPAERLMQIEKLTGVPRNVLRPDLFPDHPPRHP